uniref:Metalloendopeptidase n=1 Tax=Parastrongyloides trichosuri TaxID=131310 RepID=A0A0N4ZGQ1_PARTI
MKNIFIILISISLSTKAAIYNDSLHNWTFPINYEIQNDLNTTVIKNALEIIKNNTCLDFKEKSSNESIKSGIIFHTGNSCSFDHIGKKANNSPNYINITSDCKNNVPFIQSLIFYVLGAFPEQTRHDRDSFVSINYTNIKNNIDLTLFNISNHQTTSDYDTNYDYGSLLHYYKNDFHRNDSFNIINVLKNNSYANFYQLMIGQKNTITFNDLKLINRRYCNDKCNGIDNPCQNGGYLNPNNCTECICPHPFTNNCTDLIYGGEVECPQFTVFVGSDTGVEMFGKKKCNRAFQSLYSTKKLQFILKDLNTTSQLPCARNFSMLEVKYRKNLDVMGLCFCGNINESVGVKVTSDTNQIYVFYNGDKESDFVRYEIKTLFEDQSDNNEIKNETKSK